MKCEACGSRIQRKTLEKVKLLGKLRDLCRTCYEKLQAETNMVQEV